MSSQQDITRRKFLAYGSAAALVGAGISTFRATTIAQKTAVLAPLAAAPAVECPAGLTLSENFCLRDVALRDFLPLLGENFTAVSAQQTATLRLLEANSHARSGNRLPEVARNEPFSLLFVAEDGSQLPDAIHNVQHPATGSLKLFLGKIGGTPVSGKAYYEVAFG